MQRDRASDSYVIYDSAKADHSLGLRHYAITIGQSGPELGFAEWRVIGTPSPGPGARSGWASLTPQAFDKYWRPVQDCAAKYQAPL
jgi:hypothetical protein